MRPIRRVLRSPLGGFLGGLAIAGAFLLLLYALPLYLRPRLSEETVYRYGDFRFHYRKDAPLDIVEVAGRYEAVLEAVLQKLGVSGEELPSPIHVFLHPDSGAIRRAILRRHSPQNETLYLAVIDVLYEEDPRPAIVELVETFAWGPASSRVLKAGLDFYLGHPDTDVYAQAAALEGPDRLSLQQLRRLEADGRFLPSLYEQFNAPTAKVLLDLAQLGRLIRLGPEPEDPLQHALRVESAALVRYLVEAEGWAKLRRLWAAEAFEEGLREIYGLGLEELERRWRATVDEQGPSSPQYPLLRGRALARWGRASEARSWLERAPDREREGAALELAALALEAGRWAEADARLQGRNGPRAQSLRRRLEVYRSWRTAEPPGTKVRVHAPATAAVSDAELARLAGRAQARLQEAVAALALPWEALPERVTVFLYEDLSQARAALGVGEGVSLPQTDAARGVIHIMMDQHLDPELVRVVGRHMAAAATDSQVLQHGLAEALGRDGRDVFAEAAELLESGAWRPLRALGFDATAGAVSRPEAAALVGYLLHVYGAPRFKRLWTETSPLGMDRSLSGGLEAVYGRSLDEVEADLIAFLQTPSRWP